MSKDTLQRIRIRADGYDAGGAYWGQGPDVFIATSADGNSEFTVRANSVAEARTKIDAEKSRVAGAPRPRDAIGGHAPSKSRYEIDWKDAASSTTVRVRITHSRATISARARIMWRSKASRRRNRRCRSPRLAIARIFSLPSS